MSQLSRRLSRRIEKLEEAANPRPFLVTVLPDQTEADAIAAYERDHGLIPKGAKTTLVVHSFISRI